MIVQFFNRGKGGGSGPIDYLLGKDRDREEAKLLRGDPEETAALIDSSDYAKKYTAGCLSFEESNIPAEQKRALMDSFEECIFAGLDKDQYNCLWVEHRDKGRLELNFVIPNIELLSGKRLQPYYYAADRGRVDAWRTMQNLTHGYSDPDDPAKRQSMTQAKDLPRNTQEAAQSITDGLEALALAGKVKSRADVLETLEKAGFEHYEISNFSKPGFESRHNLMYWDNAEYYGIGAGASGYVDGVRYKNHGPIRHYLQAVEAGNARVQEEVLTLKEKMEEEMFLGLRKKSGVSKKRFEEKFGFSFEDRYGAVVSELTEQGLLVPDRDIVRMTKQGLFLGDTVAEKFILE